MTDKQGLILALDQGTTSSRAVVYNEHMQVLGWHQQDFAQHFPQPGWVEHDPEAIWASQRDCALAALAAAKIKDLSTIDALGITNQRETTMVWNRRSGEALHNAIVWQDRRTAGACEALIAAGHEPDVHQATGLLLDPYFSASKIRWILDHCDGAADAAARGELAFGTVDTWLVWKLTQGRMHITDPSNASRTALYNLADRDWDQALLDLWQIPRSMMPQIVPSSGELATCSLPGFKGISIAGIAGDQQAALFGQSCFNAGDAKCTYGTGCFLLLNTGSEIIHSSNRLLTTVAWNIDGHFEYAIEGSVFVAGAAVQWLRDGLHLIESAAEVEALAASVDDSGGVVLVPAFAGLGAPHWDPHARGALLGITRGTTGAHIARATLEGIALQVADLLHAMQIDHGKPLRTLKVDGGASANQLLMQIQSDIIQTPLVRTSDPQCTALGCAGLAGLGVDLWPNREALSGMTDAAENFYPAPMNANLQSQLQRWQSAIGRSKAWENDVGTS